MNLKNVSNTKKMDIDTSGGGIHVLTDEQLVRMSQEGSETAEELLIEKYRSLAKGKAKIYYIAGADREDVVQEGMIGLFKAIRSYDPDRDAAFRTYADMCINNQIITAIKRANRLKHQPLNESLSLSNMIADADGDSETTMGDVLRDKRENDPQELMLMREVIDCLNAQDSGIFSKFEQKVWNEKLKGHSYTEISKNLQKSPKSIDNALQRIRKKVLLFMAK